MKIKELKELGYHKLYKRALECQKEQSVRLGDSHDLFYISWGETSEGHDFWSSVDSKDFDQAKQLQPHLFDNKEDTPETNKLMKHEFNIGDGCLGDDVNREEKSELLHLAQSNGYPIHINGLQNAVDSLNFYWNGNAFTYCHKSLVINPVSYEKMKRLLTKANENDPLGILGMDVMGVNGYKGVITGYQKETDSYIYKLHKNKEINYCSAKSIEQLLIEHSTEEETNRRVDIIGQNGNTGEHYEKEWKPEKGEKIKVWHNDIEDYEYSIFFAMDRDFYVCYSTDMDCREYLSWKNAKPIEQPKEDKWYKVLVPINFPSDKWKEVRYFEGMKDFKEGCEILKTYNSEEEMLNDLKK